MLMKPISHCYGAYFSVAVYYQENSDIERGTSKAGDSEAKYEEPH